MASYIGLVHKDKDSAYGVSFPDCPGCVSAGDTFNEAMVNAAMALKLWAEAELSAGRALPEAQPADRFVLDAMKTQATMIAVPMLADAGRSVRLNISLDAGLVEAIDEAAKARGLTRSAFLASAARDKIAGSDKIEKDPEMEEILRSIRRIIAEDEKARIEEPGPEEIAGAVKLITEGLGKIEAADYVGEIGDALTPIEIEDALTALDEHLKRIAGRDEIEGTVRHTGKSWSIKTTRSGDRPGKIKGRKKIAS